MVTDWREYVRKEIHTKTEGYFMWQRDAVLGGTPSLGPLQPFGGGGGIGTALYWPVSDLILVNDTMFQLPKDDYFTVHNECWKDERGMRSGFPGNYTSHAIGLTHNFSPTLHVRFEIVYYQNWNTPAFDLGT